MPALVKDRRDLLGILIAAGSAMVFGLYPAATRGAYADGANAVFIIMLTAFCRGFTTGLFCLFTHRNLFVEKTSLKNGISNGFFQALSIFGILGGMAFMPGPVVITIMFSYTMLLYLYMVLVGEERASIVTFLSVITAFAGLGLVVGVQDKFHGLSVIGLALAALAAITTATRVYRFGQLLKNTHPAVVSTETFIFVFLFSCLLMLHQLPVTPQHLSGWLWAGLATLSLCIGNFGMFYSIAMLGPFKYAFFVKLEPVFAALFAFLLIGETLHTSQYIGIAMVVSSLLVYQIYETRRKAISP
jgi:drug/metabolite transporter (DMT)-like permease